MDANIKLGQVATDVPGLSGRRILEALIAGLDSRLPAEPLRRKPGATMPYVLRELRIAGSPINQLNQLAQYKLWREQRRQIGAFL